ncbi:hypothetical protein BJ878DRAFT_576493 [Calycina marina]|uniref:Uncharacterized protein n=1 Tax=Calycina marina TaxID=1763456 RepID=A0A9P7Z192_9HELO|nr:hypothetical protein BJ878DRAFT_576493 [Calycina marina]
MDSERAGMVPLRGHPDFMCQRSATIDQERFPASPTRIPVLPLSIQDSQAHSYSNEGMYPSNAGSVPRMRQSASSSTFHGSQSSFTASTRESSTPSSPADTQFAGSSHSSFPSPTRRPSLPSMSRSGSQSMPCNNRGHLVSSAWVPPIKLVSQPQPRAPANSSVRRFEEPPHEPSTRASDLSSCQTLGSYSRRPSNANTTEDSIPWLSKATMGSDLNAGRYPDIASTREYSRSKLSRVAPLSDFDDDDQQLDTFYGQSYNDSNAILQAHYDGYQIHEPAGPRSRIISRATSQAPLRDDEPTQRRYIDNYHGMSHSRSQAHLRDSEQAHVGYTDDYHGVSNSRSQAYFRNNEHNQQKYVDNFREVSHSRSHAHLRGNQYSQPACPEDCYREPSFGFQACLPRNQLMQQAYPNPYHMSNSVTSRDYAAAGHNPEPAYASQPELMPRPLNTAMHRGYLPSRSTPPSSVIEEPVCEVKPAKEESRIGSVLQEDLYMKAHLQAPAQPASRSYSPIAQRPESYYGEPPALPSRSRLRIAAGDSAEPESRREPVQQLVNTGPAQSKPQFHQGLPTVPTRNPDCASGGHDAQPLRPKDHTAPASQSCFALAHSSELQYQSRTILSIRSPDIGPPPKEIPPPPSSRDRASNSKSASATFKEQVDPQSVLSKKTANGQNLEPKAFEKALQFPADTIAAPELTAAPLGSRSGQHDMPPTSMAPSQNLGQKHKEENPKLVIQKGASSSSRSESNEKKAWVESLSHQRTTNLRTSMPGSKQGSGSKHSQASLNSGGMQSRGRAFSERSQTAKETLQVAAAGNRGSELVEDEDTEQVEIGAELSKQLSNANMPGVTKTQRYQMLAAIFGDLNLELTTDEPEEPSTAFQKGIPRVVRYEMLQAIHPEEWIAEKDPIVNNFCCEIAKMQVPAVRKTLPICYDRYTDLKEDILGCRRTFLSKQVEHHDSIEAVTKQTLDKIKKGLLPASVLLTNASSQSVGGSVQNGYTAATEAHKWQFASSRRYLGSPSLHTGSTLTRYPTSIPRPMLSHQTVFMYEQYRGMGLELEMTLLIIQYYKLNAEAVVYKQEIKDLIWENEMKKTKARQAKTEAANAKKAAGLAEKEKKQHATLAKKEGKKAAEQARKEAKRAAELEKRQIATEYKAQMQKLKEEEKAAKRDWKKAKTDKTLQKSHAQITEDNAKQARANANLATHMYGDNFMIGGGREHLP